MIELQPERMSKAIEKAKRVRNHIRILGWRKYQVTTPEGHRYTVTFDSRNGRKLAHCSCKAATVCYHIAGCVQVHIAIARMRQA